MATYYISPNGNDANNGLGPDASHASNKPWLTIGKALGASGIASGDTVYVGPGTYRETVTVAMTSAVANTNIFGDPTNTQGFKDGSGVRLDPLSITWTAYTTNDTTAPANAATLNLAGRDYLTFRYMTIIGGNAANGSCVDATTTTHSTNITLLDCLLVATAGGSCIKYTGVAGEAAHWLIDRCLFNGMFSPFTCVHMVPPTHSSDFDTDFIIRNCKLYGYSNNSNILFAPSGAGAGKPGGLIVRNCTIVGGVNGVSCAANSSTSQPAKVENNIIVGQSTGLNANSSGMITEDYNYIAAGTVRTNVSAGTNSKTGSALSPRFEFGQSYWEGRLPLMDWVPGLGSPFLGFGNASGAPATDHQNRARPSGGQSTSSALGFMERHNTAVQETSTVDAGSSGLKITGPGDHDIVIPVDAVATVITVRVRYDTNHATTNKPQAQLLANGEIGFTGETKTATAGVDTWETLTFSSFTPARKGFVTLRLISRSAAGSGIAYFDTITGGANGSQGCDYFRGTEPIPAAVQSRLLINPGMTGAIRG